MAEEINTSLIKTTFTDKDYYISVTFTGNVSFAVVVTNGTKSWIGSASENALRKQQKKLHSTVDWDTFCSQTRQALGCSHGLRANFMCQLEKKGGRFELSWKKHIPSENIKFQLGSIVLEEGGDMSDILDTSLHYTDNLKHQLQALETDNQRLASERATALKRLENLVYSKEEIEKDLYSKFVAVLNEKKKKIKELEDEVEALAAGGASGALSGSPGVGSSRVPSKRPASSDSIPTFDDDTDEEVEEVPKGKGKKVKTETKATLSTRDSLLLGDEEEDPKPATRRGRARRVGSKKETPSRPKLPRVSSTASSGSLKRGGSTASNRSSDNIDADDLLDDF